MSTSVSGVSTNFFTSPQSGFTTTTSGSVASAAATVGLNSVAGYSNGDVDVWVIDPTDTNKKQSFTGVVDTAGSQVTSVKWTAGTNQTHALGATVVAYTTATHQALMTKGLLVSHNQTGAITTDTIAEKTAAAGVTIDGVLHKDGVIGPASVGATSIAAGAITIGYAQITSDFSSTTVGSDVDVTGLSVTVAVPAGGRRVKITCAIAQFASGSGNLTLHIYEGASLLQLMEGANPYFGTITWSGVPSAGNHTYKISMKQSGAGTMYFRGKSYAPSFILVELI